MMGSGKTTIARQLAKQLDLKWVDTDKLIESQSGKTISDLFSVSERYFRSWESTMCNALKNYQNTIISTGGGIILDSKNRAILNKLGFVVYLSVSSETIINRLEHDTKRPLLQHENRQTILEELLVQRDPLYNEIATITLNVDSLTVNQIANKIISSRETLL